MADDREVLKEIWEGKIPVHFTLAFDEIASVEQPEPLYASGYINVYCILLRLQVSRKMRLDSSFGEPTLTRLLA